jgi:molecular chaperone GrpE
MMSWRQHDSEEREENAATGASSESSEGALDETAEEGASQEAPNGEQDIESVRGERDDLKERLLRVSADYQNYVRRAQQNVETAREQQLMEFGRSLLPVLDHFDRALSVEASAADSENILKGVQMVREELVKTLERFDIQRVDAEPGEAFDPNRHEALMRQPTDAYAPQTVVEQFQPGYRIGDKMLRPAQVSVAEPATEQSEKGSGEDEDAEGAA